MPLGKQCTYCIYHVFYEDVIPCPNISFSKIDISLFLTFDWLLDTLGIIQVNFAYTSRVMSLTSF